MQSHRLLLRAYPRWFRDRFGVELTEYLTHQRIEPRYRDRALGTARFWWDAGTDAVVTGVTLRLGRARALVEPLEWAPIRRESPVGRRW